MQAPACPECKVLIQEYEIKQILSDKDLEELDKQMQLNLVRQNSNFIQCNCGAIMEIMQGKVDFN